MRSAEWLFCALFLFPLLLAAGPAEKPVPGDAEETDAKTIRVLVITRAGDTQTEPVVARLQQLGFPLTSVPLPQVPWTGLGDYQVIVLPTQWAEDLAGYQVFQNQAQVFHEYVEAGGGLLVCQPNPLNHPDSTCQPALLPYPMTFHNWYDGGDAQRINATHAHYITEDLLGDELPFPADRVLKWDPRYTILALGAKTESPSLLTATCGKGRVVVQTGSESLAATHPFSERVLRRMVVWAAGREPARFREPPAKKE